MKDPESQRTSLFGRTKGSVTGTGSLDAVVSPLQSRRGPRRRGRFVIRLAVVGAALGVGAGAWSAANLDRRLGGDQAPLAPVTAEPTTVPTVIQTFVAATPTLPATTMPVAPTTTAPTIPLGILRPYVGPSICTALSATDSGAIVYALSPFARAGNQTLPIQVIGNRTLGPTGPFAVLLRYVDQYPSGSDRDGTPINGWNVAVHTYPNGNGDATWNLADGTQGYLRARGLDTEALTAIVAALTPRDLTAAIPGFDYAPTVERADQLELLSEHLNTGLHGRSATLACRVEATQFDYRIGAFVAASDGDPVSEFMSVIDRPVPLEVGRRDGTLIVVTGPADASAPTVAQVRNADPATWAELRHPVGG